MRVEERVKILQEARPDKWLAFSEDEPKVVARSNTYPRVVQAAEDLGEAEPLTLKIPENLYSKVSLL